MLNWPDVLHLAKTGNPAPDRKVVKTEAEWRQQLGPEEYRVTRQAGTERPFSSQMCGRSEPGIYSCLCCETVLFDASEKFESGTGWPSFTQPVAVNAIAYRFDGPAFLKRVETICNTCDAHLGHVFPDGPPAQRPAVLHECRCSQENLSVVNTETAARPAAGSMPGASRSPMPLADTGASRPSPAAATVGLRMGMRAARCEEHGWSDADPPRSTSA
jgi:peptide-methionine (R)-S-oxide reductase